MARKKRTNYKVDVEYINDTAPVLDCNVVCFDDCYVLLVGERGKAMDTFRQLFPTITSFQVTKSNLLDSKKYKHLLGVIDIEENYRYKSHANNKRRS